MLDWPLVANPYRELFTPIELGPMALKNRIVMAPTERRGSETCVEPGTGAGVHEGLIATYSERARGGVSLVILEDTEVDSVTGCVAGNETGSPSHPSLDRDLWIPALKEFTDAMHVFGAKTVPNLRHLGMIAIPKDGTSPLTASGAENPISKSRFGHRAGPDAKTASVEEIRYLQQRFADAAFRAKRANFDGVQIAGHHGFLISQFLSPSTNHRTDEYGGSLENRTRFAVELVRMVRERIGPKMAIIFAISGDELIEGGLRINESKEIAKALEAAGVDAFHVAAGVVFPFPNGHRALPSIGEPEAPFVHLAREIKEAVSVPVIANGRIKDPARALEIVRTGQADLVSLARSLITEPNWVRKVLRNEIDSIRPCIACNYCVDSVWAKLACRCSVNPDWGREHHPVEPTRTPKTVVVVGGGPAGAEAARTAALRGHRVHLLEKEERLGGQLSVAAVPPGKEEITAFKDWLIREVERLPIQVHLGTTADVESIQRLAPDVVILATGATPVLPPPSNHTEILVRSAWQVLENGIEAQRVVVVGGGATGCEVAEYLASLGGQVTIIEMLGELARDLNPLGEGIRYFLLERLKNLSVEALLNTEFIEVRGSHVVATGPSGHLELPADAVVLSMGARSRRDLDPVALEETIPEVYTIGDAQKPRSILDAIWEGASIARVI